MDLLDDEIKRLSAELQALTGSFAGAGAALHEQSEGTDPNQVISVILDESGRVSAVRPSARWAERIQPEQLGAAVLEAVQLAQAARLERWAEAARSTPSAPPAPIPEASAADGPPMNVMELLDDLTSAFDSLNRMAAEVAARGSASSVAEPPTPTDVEVVLSGLGEPAAVHVNPDWAQLTNLSRLSERLLGAFQQAYTDYDAGGGAPRPVGLALSPALKAVAANPTGALLRYAEDLRASLR